MRLISPLLCPARLREKKGARTRWGRGRRFGFLSAENQKRKPRGGSARRLRRRLRRRTVGVHVSNRRISRDGESSEGSQLKKAFEKESRFEFFGVQINLIQPLHKFD